MNEFLEKFQQRGFLHQCTDLGGLQKLPQITAYIGFDCTASSLHVGSLLQIMILRLLKNTGNTPIILLGGGTTKIGDPSFKDEARKILSDDEITRNKAGIKKVFDKFELGNCPIVDNDEWLSSLKYMEFLRDYGRYFSVNRMLSFDSVKLRMEREQSLSFLEFNYMILQAYDFVELNRRYDCNLQIGGSDQWGNIINGVELSRKLANSQQLTASSSLFGLTTPLITTASGTKMGKTSSGAVWLDEALLSSYDYYQFWRNTEDADVVRFLNFFTELPAAQIARLAELKDAEINQAKKVLAFEATKLCHGEAAAIAAEKAAVSAFEQNGSEGLPSVAIPYGEIPAYQLFFQAGLATSGGDAKRLIRGGGARIDDVKVEDENFVVAVKARLKLSSGKKKHVLIK